MNTAGLPGLGSFADSADFGMSSLSRRMKQLSGDTSLEEDIDDQMHNLYLDCNVMERNCILVSLGVDTDNLDDGQARMHEGQSLSSPCPLVLSSSEGFVKKTSESVLRELGEKFQSNDFDPVESVVLDLSMLADSSDMADQFMTKIERADTSKDFVLRKLVNLVMTKRSEIDLCMKDVHDISSELSSALHTVYTARKKIKKSCELLEQGSLAISRLQRERDRRELVTASLTGLKTMASLHRSMRSDIDSGDLSRAADCAFHILSCLRSGVYSHFTALDDLAKKVELQLQVICHKNNKALMRLVSGRYTDTDYGDVVRTCLILDHISETMGIEIADSKDKDWNIEALGCMSGLPLRIQFGLLEEMDRLTLSAAMQFVHDIPQKRRMSALQNSSETALLTLQLEGMRALAELADCSLAELYQRIPSDLIAQAVCRTCHHLTSLLHTLHRISEWHKQQIQDQVSVDRVGGSPAVGYTAAPEACDSAVNSNDDPHISISEAVAAALESAVPVVKSSTNVNSQTHSAASPSIHEEEVCEEDRAKRIQLSRLASAFESLILNRVDVWSVVQKAMAVMLSNLIVSSTIPFDEFLAMHWAVSTFSSLGEELTGPGSSAPLIAALDAFTETYSRGLLTRGLVLLHDIYRQERWRPLSLQLPDRAGVTAVLTGFAVLPVNLCSVGVLGMKGLQNTWATAAHSADGQTQRCVFESFAEFGNPFHFEDCVGLSGSSTIVSEFDTLTQVYDDANASVFPPSSDFVSFLRKDVPTSSHRDGSRHITAKLVTMELLRTTFQHLHLMYAVPSHADALFDSLIQLFGMNLCSVFLVFVPVDEQTLLLNKASKHTAAGLDIFRERERLKGFLLKCLGDALYLLTSTFPPTSSTSAGASANTDESTSSAASSISSSSSIAATVLAHSAVAAASALSSASSSLSSTVTAASHAAMHITPSVDLSRYSDLAGAHPSVESLLRNPSCCYGLVEKLVAAEYMIFAGKILQDLKFKILHLVSDKAFASCEAVLNNFHQASVHLQGLIYQSLCPQLVKSNLIICEVMDSSAGWDIKEMRREPHSWIDKLVKNCADAWTYVNQVTEFGSSGDVVREQLWLELCQAAFDALLDGFCQVRKCSSEGRENFLVDAAALHNKLHAIHPCRPPRGRSYLEAYVRAGQMMEREMMDWISSNTFAYAYRHMHGLLIQFFASTSSSKKLRDAVAVLDGLYEEVEAKEETKISSMFSTTALSASIPGKLSSGTAAASSAVSSGSAAVAGTAASLSSLFGVRSEENKLTNLFSQRLRR